MQYEKYDGKNIVLMASEEMSFENVDVDGQQTSAYPINSPMSLRLRYRATNYTGPKF